MKGSDEPRDKEATELTTTYNPANFKAFQPDSLLTKSKVKEKLLQLTEERIAFSNRRGRWLRPLDLAEALEFARELEGDYSYRHGGTGYYKKHPPPPPPHTQFVIDLSAVPELKGTGKKLSSKVLF
jgi:hypothetical protein